MNVMWRMAVAIGVLSVAACAPRAPGEVTPAAVPPVAPAAVQPPAPPSELGYHEQMTSCLVRNGRMTTTPIEYDPATGDTTVNGRLFREVYPITAEYAALAPWNAADEPIVFRGQWYRRYALPRVIGHTEIVPIDVFQGVTVFAEPGASTRHPEVIYLPFTPDCQFQPYEIAEIAGAVRG